MHSKVQGHIFTLEKVYSRFTNDMQKFSVNFSKSTKPTVLQLCRRYSYRNCEIWMESVFLVLIWLVLIWYMPIGPNAKHPGF